MVSTPPVTLRSAATARDSLPTGSGAGSMLLGVPRSASLLPEKGVDGGNAGEAEQGQKHESRKRKRADKTTAEEHEDTCVPSTAEEEHEDTCVPSCMKKKTGVHKKQGQVYHIMRYN